MPFVLAGLLHIAAVHAHIHHAAPSACVLPAHSSMPFVLACTLRSRPRSLMPVRRPYAFRLFFRRVPSYSFTPAVSSSVPPLSSIRKTTSALSSPFHHSHFRLSSFWVSHRQKKKKKKKKKRKDTFRILLLLLISQSLPLGLLLSICRPSIYWFLSPPSDYQSLSPRIIHLLSPKGPVGPIASPFPRRCICTHAHPERRQT